MLKTTLIIGALLFTNCFASNLKNCDILSLSGAIDGDTIRATVLCNNYYYNAQNASIRLLGVNTAELSSKDKCEKEFAKIAKDFLDGKLKNYDEIKLENVKGDKYFGRVDADLIIDGVNINQEIIQQGLGVAYDGGAKSSPDWCEMQSNYVNKNPLLNK